MTKPTPFIGFGEMLLRYSPPAGVPLGAASRLDVYAGGSEFDVAAAVAGLGHPSTVITALPPGPPADGARRAAAGRGVGLVGDMAAPGRMGVYYYESGAPPRPGVVTYDREHSAFALYPWHETPWSRLLPERGVFFTTGITAALGAGPLAGVQQALETAAEKGMLVAFDVNFRGKLWTPAAAARAIRPLLAHVDCLFTSKDDALAVLGAPAGPPEEQLAWIAEEYGVGSVAMVFNPETAAGAGSPGRPPVREACSDKLRQVGRLRNGGPRESLPGAGPGAGRGATVLKQCVLQRLKDIGIIPVLRASSSDDALRAADALAEAGMGTVEVTFTVPDAPRVIEGLRTRHPDLLVGAGTVLSAEAAQAAADAGALYLVSVGVVADMVTVARRHDLAAFVGVFTPTEAVHALQLGADVLKLFPASVGGPGHLAALRGPLPDAVWCPTGGVGLDNIGEWVKAGASFVGVGGPLLQDAPETGDMAGLQRRARRFLDEWERAGIGGGGEGGDRIHRGV